MKKYFKLMAALCVAFGVFACNKPDNNEPGTDPANAPVAEFDYSIDGLTVTFINKSENAVSYKWNFGDDETSKEESPVHTYASADSYTVKLTVANADGATASKTKTVSFQGVPKAYFTATAVEGRSGKYGKIIRFDATSSENAESIAWDFGDGTTGTEFTVNHEFPEFTTYTVKAVVTGASGAVSEYSANVEVIAMNELLKGTGFEEADAQYWTLTIQDRMAPYADGGESLGVPAWDATWGYTEDHPKFGQKGCLNMHLTTTRDQSANFELYQAVEVEAGDSLHISCNLKWGERTNDSGLLWFCIVDEPTGQGEAGTVIKEIFNYWGAWADPLAPIPPFDGNFAGSEGFTAEYGFAGDGVTEFAGYTATKSGTIYVKMEYRSVWGACFGYNEDVDNNVNVMIDDFSCKIIL